MRCLYRTLILPFLLILIHPVVGVSHTSQTLAAPDHTIYLPMVSHHWASPFGVEVANFQITDQSVFARANELGARWLRFNTISWRAVQPDIDSPYNWQALLNAEIAIIGAQQANLTPIMIIDDHPHWSVKPVYKADNEVYLTSCAAIREEHFADFARFMHALVARYSRPPYNIKYWEIGNEIDVAPLQVPQDNGFVSCWGDIDDPYFGGEHYGKMLQAVTPAIKAADPQARVLIGGLALGHGSELPGNPEKFFEGILKSGAADSFDIVAYHVYVEYGGREIDRDLQGGAWSEIGGHTIGKARFLRDVMNRYGVQKPLFLNETGLMFTHGEPPPDYFETQADHIVRLVTRALSEDIDSVVWYTLDGPGWRSTALLDGDQKPRQSYTSYQHLIQRASLNRATTAVLDYGAAIEAYRFHKGPPVVDVLWSRDATTHRVSLPRHNVVAAYTRDGAVIPPEIENGTVTFAVGVSPIYIERLP